MFAMISSKYGPHQGLSGPTVGSMGIRQAAWAQRSEQHFRPHSKHPSPIGRPAKDRLSGPIHVGNPWRTYG